MRAASAVERGEEEGAWQSMVHQRCRLDLGSLDTREDLIGKRLREIGGLGCGRLGMDQEEYMLVVVVRPSKDSGRGASCC